MKTKAGHVLNDLQATFISSIDAISCEQWNTLCGTDYPFLKHEFFAALEHSGSTTKSTGWQPHHLVITQPALDKKTVAVMPLFIKTHSYGEYVFDWAWADAYHRQGIEYYPKLLSSIPFTPATGPRWGIDNDYECSEIVTFMLEALEEEAKRLGGSSCHILFFEEQAQQTLLSQQFNWIKREGYQYHWFNDDYRDFDDFLSRMSSRKRKNIKKERQKIQQQDIIINTLCGKEISEQDWQDFYLFYQMTYLKRSGHGGYLTDAFFPLIAQYLSEHIVMVQAQVAEKGAMQTVAAALCFKDSACLYGRYWGCNNDYDSLHFEACYYQGIEYAIHHQLKRFDPGAQGEHKIQRGFTPIQTYSAHWIDHPEFSDAIRRFIERETSEVKRYIEDAKQLLPFKLDSQEVC